MRLLAASFAVAAMILLYRKIGDIARIMLVLWSGLLLTSIWVVVEGLVHLNTRLLFDFPPGAFHLNLAFLLGLGNGSMLVMYQFPRLLQHLPPGRRSTRAGAGNSPSHHRIDFSGSAAGSGEFPSLSPGSCRGGR